MSRVLANHVLALMESLGHDELAAMKPVELQHMQAQLRRLLIEAARIELEGAAKPSGVLRRLRRGERAE